MALQTLPALQAAQGGRPKFLSHDPGAKTSEAKTRNENRPSVVPVEEKPRARRGVSMANGESRGSVGKLCSSLMFQPYLLAPRYGEEIHG